MLEFCGWANVEYTSIEVAELAKLITQRNELLALLKRYDKHKKVCMFCNTRYHTNDCELREALDETRDSLQDGN